MGKLVVHLGRSSMWLSLALACLEVACGEPGPAISGKNTPVPFGARLIPTRYVADRFVATPVTEAGDTLTLFTDTGGGLFLNGSVARRIGLRVDSAGVIPFPAFRDDAWVPTPLGEENWRTLPDSLTFPFDGMLGQAWFANRVWTFDYPAHRLLLWDDTVARPPVDATPVALAFQTDSAGVRQTSFIRLRAEIDGDSLDFLFDTGATVGLTEGAAAAVGGSAGDRAASYITTTVLERWHAHHPGWPVVAGADGNIPTMRMIRVDRVRVGGQTVGPVWFTERPDANFHTWMAQWMDRPVDGALGGSTFRYLRVTVDYPRALAWFEKG